MEYARLTPGSGFALRQSLLYYGQRVVTSPALRRCVITLLQRGIRFRHGDFPAGKWSEDRDTESLQVLKSDGYTSLPSLLSPAQVGEIHAFFRSRLLTSRPATGDKFTIDGVPDGVRMADYDIKDIIEAPHILELANSPLLLQLAAGYIGCKPTISALGLRWSFPRTEIGTDVQAFHRDSEDWRYLKVMVYLTDVDERAGPHVFVKGSHLTKASVRLQQYKETEVNRKYGPDQKIVVTGKAGFGFAVDTAGIHKGAVPEQEPRLMLQIQYSLLPAFAYSYAPQAYCGNLKLDSYINRLFCESPEVRRELV